jgi:excisionase family DNA binding protein
MELVTLTSEAFLQIVSKIDKLSAILEKNNKSNPLSDTWLDIQQVCVLLKVSKRTLQTYRDNNVLPFSQINGKIYFKASDIEEHLEQHYIKAHKK